MLRHLRASPRHICTSASHDSRCGVQRNVMPPPSFVGCAAPGHVASVEFVCCPLECQKCGGDGCEERPGGRERCCTSLALANMTDCQDSKPCVMRAARHLRLRRFLEQHPEERERRVVNERTRVANFSSQQRASVEQRWRAVTGNPPCLNDCGLKGACVKGLCVCADGWVGLDCMSRSTLSDVPDSGGFMYVVDVPAHQGASLGVKPEPADVAASTLCPFLLSSWFDHTWAGHMQMRGAYKGAYGDAIYHSEVVFTGRLMRDWSLRTLKRAEAKLFYVPTWMYYTQNNVLNGDHRYRELLNLQLPGNASQRVFYFRCVALARTAERPAAMDAAEYANSLACQQRGQRGMRRASWEHFHLTLGPHGALEASERPTESQLVSRRRAVRRSGQRHNRAHVLSLQPHRCHPALEAGVRMRPLLRWELRPARLQGQGMRRPALQPGCAPDGERAARQAARLLPV